MKSGRRDCKNRVLRDGESQGKDGRYRYTYYDNGKQKCLYSLKLEANDKIPAGKRDCIALRVQIEELKKRQLLFGKYSESRYTVIELVERYVALKTGVRKSTQAGHQTVINVLKKDEFGSRKINDIRISDAKLWLVELQKNDKKAGERFPEICKRRSTFLKVLWGIYILFKTEMRILKKRKAPKKEPMIGKYVGFLYLDKNGMPMVALYW
ncbi:MAG: integrase DNA-binding domain-containing protein [Lachnospiraceae bacterium]